MAKELMNIAEEIRQELKKSGTTWIRLGELLDQARRAPGMESDQAFGKWCKEQEFEVGRKTLFTYRAAWQEYSTVQHAGQEKLTDFTAWSRIAGLNHLQKPRVLERLAKSEGKVTRTDVLKWIEETRVQPAAPKTTQMTKVDLAKAIKRAEAAEAAATRLQRYYESYIREIDALIHGDEGKLIRSCLHPDREAEPERKNKAFAAWQKIDSKCSEILSKTV